MFDPQFWIVCGVISCVIFTAHESYLVRGMGLAEAMILLLAYATFVLAGPFGLAFISVASLMSFLSNR